MSRLLITLMTGLLGASHAVCDARQLKADDPMRIAMVSQARSAEVKGLPAGSRLTMSRVWLDGAHAHACGVSTTSSGDPLIVEGRLQLKRVQFRKHGTGWQVARADRASMGLHDRLDAACGVQQAEPTMMAAIKELESNPPAAGGAGKPRQDTPTSCNQSEPKHTSARQTGEGRVGKSGRSLLHSAPDLSCYIGKFIVGGDKVNILARVVGWARVSYTHPVTHVTTVGWLKDNRVKLSEPVQQTPP